MIRTITAIAATVALTLALAVGLGIDPANPDADGPRPGSTIQSRPISAPVDGQGLPNLGVYKIARGSR